jgi:protein-S-isoprenylcysteine O-methyltransferase Ste14
MTLRPSLRSVTAIDIQTAEDVGLVLVTVAVILAVCSLWVLKTIVAKALTVVVLGGIAVAVWTQRTELQDCADRVEVASGSTTTCAFFGSEVSISAATPP